MTGLTDLLSGTCRGKNKKALSILFYLMYVDNHED